MTTKNTLEDINDLTKLVDTLDLWVADWTVTGVFFKEYSGKELVAYQQKRMLDKLANDIQNVIAGRLHARDYVIKNRLVLSLTLNDYEMLENMIDMLLVYVKSQKETEHEND